MPGENESAKFAPDEMVGATETSDGSSGLVPAPKVGEEDFFLAGDGTFRDISSAITSPENIDDFITNLNEGLN